MEHRIYQKIHQGKGKNDRMGSLTWIGELWNGTLRDITLSLVFIHSHIMIGIVTIPE